MFIVPGFVGFCIFLMYPPLYGICRYLLYRPLYNFCVGMPEDGISTGRNKYHTCKGNQMN